MTTTRIVGLGSMGAGMARNLLKGGFALAVTRIAETAAQTSIRSPR